MAYKPVPFDRETVLSKADVLPLCDVMLILSIMFDKIKLQIYPLSFLCDSNCFHGEWKCRRTRQCEQQKPQSCTVAEDSLGRSVQSSCPRGFYCKVQIPGIPDAGIPEVAVCVPGKPTGMLMPSIIITRSSNKQLLCAQKTFSFY